MYGIGVELSEGPSPPANDTSAGAVVESLAWVATFMEVENFCAGAS